MEITYAILTKGEPELPHLLSRLVDNRVILIYDPISTLSLPELGPNVTVLRRPMDVGFGHQRNRIHSILNPGDWVMWIDTDELPPLISEIESAITEAESLGADAVRVSRLNVTVPSAFFERHIRAYKVGNPFWRYQVHELLTNYKQVFESTIQLLHVKTPDGAIRRHEFYGERFKHKPLNIEASLEIDGWMSEPELMWLAELAATNLTGVEVGCWCGRSTRALVDNTMGRIISVDPFVGVADRPEMTPDMLASEFFKHTILAQVTGRLTHFPMTSVRAAEQLRVFNFGFVFIDDDHSPDGVSASVNSWWPLVTPGGILCGHDYSHDTIKQGIAQSVIKDCEITNPPETTIWVCCKPA